MTHEQLPTSKRLLSPEDRISEALFGLIMVITFTGSLSIADAGRDDVRTMLIGALGCNMAWGIIDAVIYLMGCMAERGRAVKSLRALKNASSPEASHRIIAETMPPMIASVMKPEEFAALRERLAIIPEPAGHTWPGKHDWLGALGVFLLVFLATFPVTIPFMLMTEVAPALRISNGIAIAMLFGLGYSFGRCVGRNPWLYATAMVVLGVLLVAMTKFLGG